MSTLQIIGLSGKAGSGKDFIFDNILKPMGYYRWALADHFKIWSVGRGLLSYEEVFITKPPHVRKILQQTGTEEGRNVYGENVWLETAYAWMQHLNRTWNINKFCVTDCRFPNELEYLKEKGAKTLRVISPKRTSNSSLTSEARNHISEIALDNYDLSKFDGIIYNDPEYEDSLEEQILVALGYTTFNSSWCAGDYDSPFDEDL